MTRLTNTKSTLYIQSVSIKCHNIIRYDNKINKKSEMSQSAEGNALSTPVILL